MKEVSMPTPQSRNLLGVLSMTGSTGGIFQSLKRQTAAAGFIAYCGIISAVLGLWMWLWRDTTLQDKTLTRTVGVALVLSSIFFYQHLRRGFGAFFLILTSTGIGIAIHYSNHPMINGDRPEIPAIALITIGLIAYFAQTRYLQGFLFLLASSIAIIGILCFNPALFCPIVMVIAGGVLIFLGMLIRSLAMFNSFM
jgi:hypothetical protein